MAKNLGIIAVSLALILLIIILYLVCKYSCKSQSCWSKIASMIQKKVFFSGIFRYIIVGYLKLMNQFAQMLLIGLATMEDPGLIPLSLLVVICLTLWPVFTVAFLIRKRNKLEKPAFKEKYSSLYQGIKTNSFLALCYNGVFAVRRFDLILINILFTKDSPITGVSRSHYLDKIVCLLYV